MVQGVFSTAMLEQYSALLWDFDGVIKESVEVKTNAYARLFEPFGADLATRVRAHHERNGGLSRFEKIPIYLQWAGLVPTQAEVSRYCAAFAGSVMQAVVESPWVPGVLSYLETHHEQQRFAVISATPQEEMQEILQALRINGWFRAVYGAPTPKVAGIAAALADLNCPRVGALLIGDSESDYHAANAAGVDFLLRCTVLNRALQGGYTGPRCGDFLDG